MWAELDAFPQTEGCTESRCDIKQAGGTSVGTRHS